MVISELRRIAIGDCEDAGFYKCSEPLWSMGDNDEREVEFEEQSSFSF